MAEISEEKEVKIDDGCNEENDEENEEKEATGMHADGSFCRCVELKRKLIETMKRLGVAEAEISRLNRLNAITNEYNDELRRQLDSLNTQLQLIHSSGATGGEGGGDGGSTDSPGQQETLRSDATNECQRQNCDEGLIETVASDNLQFHDPLTSLENLELRRESMKSLMNEIQATAETTVAQSNFIFDPKTSMYYDSQSGYYYDAEKSLYYEPYSGYYYIYNCDTQAYEYHSQIDYLKYSTLYHIIFNQGNTTEETTSGQRGTSKQTKKKTSMRKRKLELENCRLKTATTDDTDENGDRGPNHLGKKHKTRASGRTRRAIIGSPDRQKPAEHSPISKANEEVASQESRNACFTEDTQERPDAAESLGEGEWLEETSGLSASECSSSETELEEGELSSSSSSDVEGYLSCVEDNGGLCETGGSRSNVGAPIEVVRCTPCLRIVVKSSDCLPVGKLFVVTCTSLATIGRDESLDHSILIPDPLVSKMHCDIKYDEELTRYVVQDHASQCGTFVNGKRLARTKTISDRCPLYNGDNIRLNRTTLDVHIHPGNDTCANCEPGNFLSVAPPGKVENKVLSKEERETERRRQLRAMRKRYGLEKMNFETNCPSSDNAKKYQDRSAERRAKVGSDNPHERDDLPASVFRPITSENKGHKLLSRMGWEDGRALGKSQQGITEPIQVNLRVDQSAGLGAESSVNISADDVVSIHSSRRWIKARQRYNKIASFEKQDQKFVAEGR